MKRRKDYDYYLDAFSGAPQGEIKSNPIQERTQNSRMIKNMMLSGKNSLKMQIKSTPDLRKIIRQDLQSNDFQFDTFYSPTIDDRMQEQKDQENFIVKEIEYQKLLIIQQRQEQQLKAKLLR